MNVQSIIGDKGTDVATIAQTATLHDAVAALGERRIGALVVSGDGRSIEGIISERDIVRATAQGGAVGARQQRRVRSCRPTSSPVRSATGSTVSCRS